MLCPTCKVELKMADRQGIELDYCPQCRGVWLDRGELDKVIERSVAMPAPSYPQPAPGDYRQGHGDDRYRHRKKKSFLSEMFDFD
jgi:Zn-finger nucleic acid-binding protein